MFWIFCQDFYHPLPCYHIMSNESSQKLSIPIILFIFYIFHHLCSETLLYISHSIQFWFPLYTVYYMIHIVHFNPLTYGQAPNLWQETSLVQCHCMTQKSVEEVFELKLCNTCLTINNLSKVTPEWFVVNFQCTMIGDFVISGTFNFLIIRTLTHNKSGSPDKRWGFWGVDWKIVRYQECSSKCWLVVVEGVVGMRKNHQEKWGDFWCWVVKNC